MSRAPPSRNSVRSSVQYERDAYTIQGYHTQVETEGTSGDEVALLERLIEVLKFRERETMGATQSENNRVYR